MLEPPQFLRDLGLSLGERNVERDEEKIEHGFRVVA